jgi:hypothetical protein
MIAAAVPGGSTYWNSIRIQKLMFWGQDFSSTASQSVPLTVEVTSVSGWSQPPMQYSDQGTGGQKRSTVGFKLGLLDQARYFGPADSTVVATVKTAPTSTVVVRASVELVSPLPV